MEPKKIMRIVILAGSLLALTGFGMVLSSAAPGSGNGDNNADTPWAVDYSGPVSGLLAPPEKARPVLDSHIARFIYPVQRPWMMTSVNLKAGQTVYIQARGLASTSSRKSYLWIGPEGTDPQYVNDLSQPKPRLPRYALIGKLGKDGVPFYIGAGYEFTPKSDGVLCLGYTDDNFSDNQGQYVVDVYVGTEKSVLAGQKELDQSPWEYAGD